MEENVEALDDPRGPGPLGDLELAGEEEAGCCTDAAVGDLAALESGLRWRGYGCQRVENDVGDKRRGEVRRAVVVARAQMD